MATETVRDVMTIGEASSLSHCMIRSQKSLAQLSLVRRLRWTKIVCERKR
jgi:hypothetical protein